MFRRAKINIKKKNRRIKHRVSLNVKTTKSSNIKYTSSKTISILNFLTCANLHMIEKLKNIFNLRTND